MIFLNQHSLFTKHPGVEFYTWGTANVDWEYVLMCCREGKFPTDIRGRFAFYYHDADNTIAAVNHLSERPLYYTDEGRWFPVLETFAHQRQRTTGYDIQMGMLGFCYTIGEHTPFAGISRVKPEHYYHNGVQYRYSDVARPRGYKWNAKTYRTLLTNSMDSHIRSSYTNSMLFSSGRDSAVIASALAQIGLSSQVDFYTIEHPETSSTEYPDALVNGEEVDVAPVSLRANIVRPPHTPVEFNDSAWLVKYATLEKHDIDGLIITGEVGNVISYGETGKRLNYFTNCYGLTDVEALASMLCSHCENFKQTTLNCSSFSDQFDKDPTAAQPQWQMIVDEIEDDLQRWGYYTSDNLDYKRNCIINAGCLHHKVFRLRGYSTDVLRHRTWLHPLADYYVMEYTLGLNWYERERHDCAKWYYQRAYRRSYKNAPFAISAWNNQVRGLGIKCQE